MSSVPSSQPGSSEATNNAAVAPQEAPVTVVAPASTALTGVDPNLSAEERAAINAVKVDDVYSIVTLSSHVPEFIDAKKQKLVDEFTTDEAGNINLNPTPGNLFKMGANNVLVNEVNMMEIQDIAMQEYFLAIENLEEALSIVAYQGFDPVKFYPHFARFCNKLNMSCARVGLMILSAFVMRGTNVKKMQGKSTDEFRALVKSWVDAGLKQKSNDAKAITVGRVAALYPQFTCFVNTFAIVNELKEDTVGITNLPVHLRFTGAPSILSDDLWAAYESDYYSYMRDFTRVISKDPKTGKAIDEDELNRRVATVKAIAVAQRKKNGYHYKMMGSYRDFLTYRSVVDRNFKLVMVKTIGFDSIAIEAQPYLQDEPEDGPSTSKPAPSKNKEKDPSSSTSKGTTPSRKAK